MINLNSFFTLFFTNCFTSAFYTMGINLKEADLWNMY